MKAKRSIYNLIAALTSQGIIMILGFIIPRLTLTNYGSEINGYMTMVSQVYAYIGLLEAGLSTAVVQALYSPVTSNDKDEISSIINAAQKYYFKIARYYAIVVLAVSIILPLFINTSLSKIEMSIYFLLFGVSNVINFCFTAEMRPLLLAEGKNYVNSNITLIFHICSQMAKIVLLMWGTNIVILQLVYSVINIAQIGVYYFYFKRAYKWINRKISPNNKAIKQRSAFLGQQISNLIFSCTDVMLLSFFCDLKVASVYAVYMLIFNSISIVMSTITSSTHFILGQEYNSNRERYVKVHRIYESIILIVAFSLFTTAALLTIPFIKIYTVSVTDINYVDNLLPIMFCLNGLLATCKGTSLCLINFSFHAKQTMNRTFFEAGLNLIISLVLVSKLGIRGVLIGTGVALLYRLIDTLFYSNHVILKTSVIPTAKLYTVNFLVFAIIVYISIMKDIVINSWGEFVVAGLVYSLICGAAYIFINIIVNVKLYKEVFEIFISKLKGRKK